MPEISKSALETCPPTSALAERQLLSAAQARELTDIFKVLANDTRLRLLHALVRTPELGVNELAAAVGMKPQAISNQLQRLAAQAIVGSRRNGNKILYRIVDSCVPALLDNGLCLVEGACTPGPAAQFVACGSYALDAAAERQSGLAAGEPPGGCGCGAPGTTR